MSTSKGKRSPQKTKKTKSPRKTLKSKQGIFKPTFNYIGFALDEINSQYNIISDYIKKFPYNSTEMNIFRNYELVYKQVQLQRYYNRLNIEKMNKYIEKLNVLAIKLYNPKIKFLNKINH